MTFSSGNIVLSSDYNSLAWGGTQTYRTTPNNVAYVMGLGSGEYGYGQDVSAIDNVTDTNLISSAQWTGLINLINKGRQHQGNAAIGGGYGVGNTVVAYGNVTTAIDSLNLYYGLFFAQGSTTTGTNLTTNWNVGATTGAVSTTVQTKVTFVSADAARHFFNAGGELRFYCSGTAIDTNPRSQSSADMVSEMGGLNTFRKQTNGGRIGTGGTLTSTNTAIGYYDMVFNSPTAVVNLTSDNSGYFSYTSDTASISVFTDDPDTTRSAKGRTVIFRITLNSAATTSARAININVVRRVDIVAPSTTYLTNSWGSITVAAA